jgi:hypothetical protein
MVWFFAEKALVGNRHPRWLLHLSHVITIRRDSLKEKRRSGLLQSRL